jgi:ketosteroid isomerase-like protein
LTFTACARYQLCGAIINGNLGRRRYDSVETGEEQERFVTAADLRHQFRMLFAAPGDILLTTQQQKTFNSIARRGYMKRFLLFAAVGFPCLALIACQTGTGALSEQDKAAIRTVVGDAEKQATVQNADWAAYVKLYYAEDAMVLMPNTPPVQGRAAIQATMASFPPISAFKAEIVDMDGRGDLAYVRGNYSMTMNPPGAPAMTDKGKYVEVWKKQPDGTWKVSCDSWSSDLPMPGLVVPTGAMAANASAEVQKLGDVVGRWQIDGTSAIDPKAPPKPVALSLDCQWFTGGLAVVCAYAGASAGQPYQETDIYSYDSKTKTYTIYSVTNPGGAMPGRLAIEPGKWTHVWDLQMESKSAKQRLVIANMTPEGGTWKSDMSIAGGPWVTTGEGKYAKVK